MDIKTLRQYIANKAPKKKQIHEAPQYDGKVNQVIFHNRVRGEAIIMVHEKHDKGEHSIDRAAFALLKPRLGSKLKALTKLKIDNTPVRTSTGNYWLVKVEFVTHDFLDKK